MTLEKNGYLCVLLVLVILIIYCLMTHVDASRVERGVSNPDISLVVSSPVDDLSAPATVTMSIRDVQDEQESPAGDNLTALVKMKENTFDEECNYSRNINELNCEKLYKELVNLKALLNSNQRACYGPNSRSVKFFNPGYQLCCNGQLFNRTSPNLSCCDNLVIDTSKMLCCNDTVHHQNTDRSVQCCGIFTYNIKNEICCYGNLYRSFIDAACCSDKVYRSDTQLCCNSTVIQRESSVQQCCGNSSYNRKTQICCDGHVSNAFWNDNKKGRCCGTRYYNTECSVCVNETDVVPIINTRHVCCPRHNVSLALALCCEEHVCNGHILNGAENGMLNTTHVNKKIARDAYVIIAGCVASTTGVFVLAFGYVCFQCKQHRKRLSSSMVINETCVEDICRSESPTFDRRSISKFENETDFGEVEGKCIYWEKNGLLLDSDFGEKLNVSEKFGLLKKTDVANDNILENLFVDRCTQTCVKKVFNKETVLGAPFECVGYLDADKPTFTMPNSEAVLTLPADMLDRFPVEVHGSTFRSIPTIRERFKLDNTEAIASPTAEYWITGYDELPGYACLVYPFIGDANDLKVWKFASDQEMYNPVKRIPVPRKGKMNEDLPMFFETKGSSVYIYTKSFSGFICTTCGQRSLSLRAFLYGSYKRFRPGRSEVRLALYIADDLNKFEDYRERMDEFEAVNGRMIKGEMKLKLPDVLEEEDIVKVTVNSTGAHDGLWDHKLHPRTKEPIYSEIQSVPIREVVYSCKDCYIGRPCHAQAWEIPYKFEWYLNNRLGKFPNTNYQCIVDIICERHKETGEAQSSLTPIIVDELTLRPEDLYRHEESRVNQHMMFLREYLKSMEQSKQCRFLSGIKSVCQISAPTIENCLHQLDQSMKPAGMNEVIIRGLQQAKLFEELDNLIEKNILKVYSMQYPVQRVQPCEEPATQPCQFPFNSSMNEEELSFLKPHQESPNKIENSREQNRSDGICRRELETNSFAPALTSMQTSNAMNEYFDKNYNSSDPLVPPVQEHASLDETELKEGPERQ